MRKSTFAILALLSILSGCVDIEDSIETGMDDTDITVPPAQSNDAVGDPTDDIWWGSFPPKPYARLVDQSRCEGPIGILTIRECADLFPNGGGVIDQTALNTLQYRTCMPYGTGVAFECPTTAGCYLVDVHMTDPILEGIDFIECSKDWEPVPASPTTPSDYDPTQP